MLEDWKRRMEIGAKLDANTPFLIEENKKIMEHYFPGVLAEGGINWDVLKAYLGFAEADSRERYHFTWPGKMLARQSAYKPTSATLLPQRDKSVDWDTTQNIYIEGDNFEVLKLLQKSYYRKVKMIYIDPPYNTGKDFVYKDDHSQPLKKYLELTGQVDGEGAKMTANTEKDGRFHSNWLNMIYPRLLLARNLLRDDGVVFISIDDHEQANLKKVCDEIFGEYNFITQMIWNSSTGGGIRPKYVSISHQSILCYARNLGKLPKFFAPLSKEAIEQYNCKDARGRYREKDFAWKTNSENENQRYGIVAPDGEILYPAQGYLYRFIEETFNEAKENDMVVFKKTETSPLINQNGNKAGWNIYIKKYLGNGTGAPISVIPRSLVGINNEGTSELEEMMGKRVFSNPKNIRLLRYLMSFGSDNESIILDFFSGSSSTAHALMEQNIIDGGTRRYILVQLPEKLDDMLSVASTRSEKQTINNAIKFCEEEGLPKTIASIGEERIRRAAAKLKEEHPEAVFDGGFRVYSLAASNLVPWEELMNQEDLPVGAIQEALRDSYVNLVPGRSKEDLLTEVLLKMGLDLTAPMSEVSFGDNTIYEVGAGLLYICLDDRIPLEVAEKIAELASHTEGISRDYCRVVFLDLGFEDIEVKLNALEVLKGAGLTADRFVSV